MEQFLPERTPADVSGQNALLFGVRLPAFFFEGLQQFECCAVAVETLNRAAADDLQRVIDVEVLRLRRGRGRGGYFRVGSIALSASGVILRAGSGRVSGSSISVSRSAISRASVTGRPDWRSSFARRHIRS